MDDLSLYLSTLFEGLEGYVYSPVKAATWEQHWFEYPQELDSLKRHIQSSSGDVYISPAVYSEKRATKDRIKKVQCVWIEFDGAETIAFDANLEPNLIVQTSYTTHLHCYWRVGTHPAASIEDINRRLTHALGADSSGWDATQLLRPPGTHNHKRDLPVILTSSNSASHQLTQFDYLPKIAETPREITEVGELILVGKILKDHQLPLKLVRMIKKEEPVEPYRSSFLAKLALELAEEELSHPEIVSCLFEADKRIGKYVGRSDQLIRLSQLADYAVLKHLVEGEVVLMTPVEILERVDDLVWIIPQWLHTTGFLILSAAPAVGKTQMAMQLAYCLNKHVRFLGFEPADQPYNVLFLSLEMDFGGLKYIFNHHKHRWAEGPPDFLVGDESSSLSKYEDIIFGKNINVVVIDSLSELLEDTDSPSSEARRVMLWIRKIRRRYGCAVVMIHHNRKATEGNKKPKQLADLAGTFQFAKEIDTALQLWEDHKGIELSAVKVRFGMKVAFMVDRDEHLWFDRRDSSASNASRTNRPDSGGDQGNFGIGGRH